MLQRISGQRREPVQPTSPKHQVQELSLTIQVRRSAHAAHVRVGLWTRSEPNRRQVPQLLFSLQANQRVQLPLSDAKMYTLSLSFSLRRRVQSARQRLQMLRLRRRFQVQGKIRSSRTASGVVSALRRETPLRASDDSPQRVEPVHVLLLAVPLHEFSRETLVRAVLDVYSEQSAVAVLLLQERVPRLLLPGTALGVQRVSLRRHVQLPVRTAHPRELAELPKASGEKVRGAAARFRELRGGHVSPVQGHLRLDRVLDVAQLAHKGMLENENGESKVPTLFVDFPKCKYQGQALVVGAVSAVQLQIRLPRGSRAAQLLKE